MTCNWKGCEAPKFAIGLCSRHYNRLRTTGTCEDGARARRPFSERLWSKIERRGPDECWPWLTKTKIAGYGAIGRGGRGGGHVLAHRAVWEEAHGPIPKPQGQHHGMVVMHTCDNRLCCNLAHLRLGTQADNVKDMDAKARRKTVARVGEACGASKYTEQQVRAVKRATGPYAEIAKQTGVALGSVKAIKRGKVWRHLK